MGTFRRNFVHTSLDTDISQKVSLSRFWQFGIGHKVEVFEFITERKLWFVTAVSTLFGIVSFYSAFLVAFHIDHTAVDINGDGFKLALSQQLSEDLEVDFSQQVGCFVTEVSQKA